MFRFLIVISALFLFSCTDNKGNDKKATIAVTNFPLYWLVETITGESVDIIYNVPSDIDPAFWKPKDSDITSMQNADLILLNGATYEKWLTSVALPKSKIVNTSKNCSKKFITIKDAMVHEHNGKKHTHDGIDFNTWLDSEILSIQSEEVLKQLIKLNPKKAEEYKKNHNVLILELKSVFMDIKKASGMQKRFLASHPVYDYLGRSNGWELKNFHWEPEEMPSDEEWEKFKAALSHSKYILYEDEPSKEVVDKLKSFGVKVIVFRTAGNTPASKDLIQEMKANLKNLKQVISL